MGVSPARARGCIRFSLGIYNTGEEVDHLLKHLPQIIGKLREISPAGSPARPAAGHPAASTRPKHDQPKAA
jgi:cysteine desulfurase